MCFEPSARCIPHCPNSFCLALGSLVEGARHPLGVLPLTVSVDGSDATLQLWMDEKPTTGWSRGYPWIIEAESTWLTVDSGVFEEPIAEVAEDVNGSPSTHVVSCTFCFLLCSSIHDSILAVVVSKELHGMLSKFQFCLRAFKDWTFEHSTFEHAVHAVHSNIAHIRVVSIRCHS